MAPVRFAELSKLSGKQHGLMTHAQATAAGLSRMALSRLVRKGAWQMVRPRVFRRAAASQTEGQALLAVCLWLGKGAVVSHRSAARLHGLDVKQGDLEVSTSRFREEVSGVRIHRSKPMDAADLRVLREIPVTSGARTMIDLASCFEEEQLAYLVEEAWRKQIAPPDWIARRLGQLGTQGRRAGALSQILLDCRERKMPMRSALEVRVWRLLKKAKLPMPIPGYEFRDDFGQPGCIDLAFPEQQLALECDGYQFHGDRETFERDRVRAARLVALGWRVMPVTWRQLDEQRDNVIARIRQALRFRTTPLPDLVK
jgi:very-short-patch-repair endonuclease/predicted transcriptional regulator of viral defense system